MNPLKETFSRLLKLHHWTSLKSSISFRREEIFFRIRDKFRKKTEAIVISKIIEEAWNIFTETIADEFLRYGIKDKAFDLLIQNLEI